MANEYIRKEWAGGTVRTTLNGNINSTATSITLTDGSSFPSGVKPFVLVIDRGTAAEEKIICTSRTGNTLTVLQRGYDGSSQQAHSTGAYVEHILDAYTVDQANAMSAAMTTQGDIIYKTVTGDNTSFGRLGIGTTGYPLVSAGSAPAYQQLGQTGIASTAVTAAKINSDVAGLGLVKNGTSGALDVNVDNSTIEIATDTVRVKSGGILQTHIGVNQIVDSQIASNAAIAFSKLAGLTSGSILVGNGSNVAAAVPVTGDISITNAGVTSITAGAVQTSKLATGAGEIAGSWTTFTQATARTADNNITGLTLTGAYWKVGKTVMFRISAGGTATASGSITVGLPTVIGTVPGIQPVNALKTTGGVNKETVSARMDSGVTARVQIYDDAGGNGFIGGAAFTVTAAGTFEVS